MTTQRRSRKTRAPKVGDTIDAPRATDNAELEVRPAEEPKPPQTVKEDKNRMAMEDMTKEIDKKIKSRHFTKVSSVVVSQRFNVSNRDGLDYTVGGRFKGHWFRNEEGRILTARQQGYYMPEEVHKDLKNLTMGNLILLLQTTEAREDYTVKVEQKNRQLEGTQMGNHALARNSRLTDFDVIKPR